MKKEIKNKNQKYKNKRDQNKKDNSKFIWLIKISIITFLLSIIFSFVSSIAISDLPVIPAIIILLIIIFLGIIFDAIGVAVTVASESDFNAMAAKKIKGAKTSLKLIKNSPKVSNICGDVIGDIAGVLSGAISALLAIKVTSKFNLGFDLQFIISAIVASITVGGKSLGKNIAQTHSTKMISYCGKVLNIFSKKKNK